MRRNGCLVISNQMETSDNKKVRVAVLYICTGKYNRFFADFHESAGKFFLKGIADVEYFVFTDDNHLTDASDVHLIHKESQGYPLDSLFRFDMFLSLEQQLQAFDYCYFFNANMLFVDNIGRDFLPEKEGVVAVIHPGYYTKPAWRLPYERRRSSTAYIPPYQGNYHYYMGSLNGGKIADYMEFARVCAKNTHADYDRGIVAEVIDESHLNLYVRSHPCKGLHPSYAYPEDAKLPFKPKIIIREKAKFDSYFDTSKGRSHTLMGTIKKASHILWQGIRWYLYL